MKNYYITGHLGQIGRELKKRLDKNNYKCIGASDKKSNTKLQIKGLSSNSIFFHLAANCVIRKIITYPYLAFLNSEITYYYMQLCRRSDSKFIYFSSSRVLSKEKNAYTASKLYGEELCKAYKQCYNIDYLIIRPSTVYGGKDDTVRLIERWIRNAKKGKDLVIFGDKNKTLNFTHINDFLDALMIILKNGKWNEEYNIFGFEEKVINVAKEIIKQTKSKSKIVYKLSEIAQPQKVSGYDKKLTKLGYKPKIKIKEGIRKTLEYGK